MAFPLLTIRTEAKKSPTAKSRSFSVNLLGFLTADALREAVPDSGKPLRPVWIAYGASERESHPFTANLRGGRKAATQNDAFEIPKRSGFRWTAQKVPGGLITVAYLPELFHLEPVVPPDGHVRFVFAPPRWWIAEQAEDLAADFGDDAPDAARAALFCAYLDRRTPLPLVHDLRFHLRVYRAALEAPWTHRMPEERWQGGEAGFLGRGAEALGLDAPSACSIEEPELADFLVRQTSLYHKEEIRRGKTRIAAAGRLLPYPSEAPAQLRFDFAVAS
jgi:hypothetical protein